MADPTSNQPAAIPDGVPPQHVANVQRLLETTPPQAPDATRFVARDRRAIPRSVADVDVDADAEVEVDATCGIDGSTLDFIAAPHDPDESRRQWQPVGSISLREIAAADCEWFDLLCIARRGGRHAVLPVQLEDPAPDEGDEETDGLRMALVLQRAERFPVAADELRSAFARQSGVSGACTPAEGGMFVVLMFELA